jgi:phosphoglycerate kinase
MIAQDHRLKAILPTISYLQGTALGEGKKTKIILATHIGRPEPGDKANFLNKNLSTKILFNWFEKNGLEVEHEVDLLEAIEKSSKNPEKILLLENLRFFKGEVETNDEFAKLLRKCADAYVNDAFGLIHREDTSVTLLAKEFKDREFGPLVKKEFENLSVLKENPEQPFSIVLGGSKAKTKIDLLHEFLEQPEKKRVKKILLGGVIANTFLFSDEDRFLEKAKNYGVEVFLPVDFMVTSSLEKEGKIKNREDIEKDDIIVDIGPKTIEMFSKEIFNSKTIFTNGTMGIYEKENFSTGSRKILEAVVESDAFLVIGGGDAVAAADKFGLLQKLSKKTCFVSTGGGATLAYLAAKDFKNLPAIKAMIKL